MKKNQSPEIPWDLESLQPASDEDRHEFLEMIELCKAYRFKSREHLTVAQRKRITGFLEQYLQLGRKRMPDVGLWPGKKIVSTDDIAHTLAFTCIWREIDGFTHRKRTATGFRDKDIADFVASERRNCDYDEAIDRVHKYFPMIDRETVERYYTRYYSRKTGKPCQPRK